MQLFNTKMKKNIQNIIKTKLSKKHKQLKTLNLKASYFKGKNYLLLLNQYANYQRIDRKVKEKNPPNRK